MLEMGPKVLLCRCSWFKNNLVAMGDLRWGPKREGHQQQIEAYGCSTNHSADLTQVDAGCRLK